MTSWSLDTWDRLEAVVKSQRFSGANDEFNEFKAVVLKASPDELEVEAAHARIGWEFLVGFAEIKAMYRSFILKIIEKLAAVPCWKAAYNDVEDRLSDRLSLLHVDIVQALDAMNQSTQELPQAAAFTPPLRQVERTTPAPEWPDWAALEAIVASQKLSGANEEFGQLRQAVKDAMPEDIASQSQHAKVAWQFLAGFAEKKRLYAAQIKEVGKALSSVPSWDASLRSVPEFAGLLTLIEQEAKRSSVTSEATRSSSTSEAKRSSVTEQAKEEMKEPTAAHAPAQAAAPDVAAAADVDARPVVDPLQPRASPSSQRSTEEDLFGRLAALNDAVNAMDSAGLEKRATDSVTAAAEPARAADAESSTLAPAPPTSAPAPAPATPAKQEDAVVQLAMPFLQQAAELDVSDPAMANYCRIHAVELLLRERQAKRSSRQSDVLLMATMDAAEAKKEGLDLSNGPEMADNFARRAYKRANDADRAGPLTGDLPVQLSTAATLLDVLAQFPKTQPDVVEMASYARRRAAHLRDCLQRGAEPEPPRPPHDAVAPEPRTPATATVAVAGLPRARRNAEARKRADKAAAAIEAEDVATACKLLREALGFLDGLP